MVLTFNC